jgi:hypothetical protein
MPAQNRACCRNLLETMKTCEAESMNKRPGCLARIIVFCVAAAAFYLIAVEPEKVKATLQFLFGGWAAGPLWLLGSAFLFWLATQGGSYDQPPCPVCGGSGQGSTPRENEYGQTVYVCSECQGATPSFQANLLMMGLCGFAAIACGLIGMYHIGQLVNGPDAPKKPNAAQQQPDKQPVPPSESGRIEAAKWRTWTAAAGGFRIDAKFISRAGSDVILEKRDRQRITVAWDQLSADDQDFIENQRWLQP